MPAEVSVTKQKGISPGYLMVIAGAIMLYWACGSYMYSFGNFVKPLTNAFGWSRAQVSLAFSFARLEGGLEGPFAGIATDKLGPRAVCLAGFILLGLGFIAMYYVNSLHGIQYWGDSSPGGSTGKLVRKEKRLHASPYAVRDVLLRSDNGTVYDVAPS